MNTDTLSTIQSNQAELDRLKSRFEGIATDVSLSSKDWRSLMESGALASLSISRYRGHKALSAADLGLDKDEMAEVESIVSLGHRLLLPKEILGQFNSLESNARQVLRRYTLKVPSGYFLPVSAYEPCALAMAEHKSRFDTLTESLMAELPTYQYTIKAQYETLAAQVSKRLYNANVLSYGDKWRYEEEFVTRCMATYPLESDLRPQFSFDLRLQFVPLPYSNQAPAPAYANPTDDLLALRKAVIAEQTKIETEEIRGFVSAIQSEVYTMVNEALSNVLSGIKDKGVLHSRSTVELKRVVERLSQLNFWDDGRLNIIKEEITAILDRSPAKRDLAVNTASLETMQTEVKLMLLKIGTVERGDLDLTAGAGAATPSIKLQTQPEPIKLTAPAKITNISITRQSSNRLF